jgi:siroheme synthase
MGRSTEIATTLMDAGWAIETPAAIVIDASAAHQRVWHGTLQELSLLRAGESSPAEARFVLAASSAPATIVVGDVVQVAADAIATAERKYVTGT